MVYIWNEYLYMIGTVYMHNVKNNINTELLCDKHVYITYECTIYTINEIKEYSSTIYMDTTECTVCR